jgi:hypothetical protein
MVSGAQKTQVVVGPSESLSRWGMKISTKCVAAAMQIIAPMT